MAGRPKLRELAAKIERLARSEGYERGIEWVCARYADGWTRARIVNRLGSSVWMFEEWCDDADLADADVLGGHTRRAYIERARRRRGESFADEAVEILDDAADAEEPHHVTAAKNRAEMRLRLAKADDRARYGEEKGAGVQINIGTLHLEAIKQVKAEIAQPQAMQQLMQGEIVVENAEIVSECEQADTEGEGDEDLSSLLA